MYKFNLIIDTHNKRPNIVKIIWANLSYHYSVTVPRFNFTAVVLKSQKHIFKNSYWMINYYILKYVILDYKRIKCLSNYVEMFRS